MTEKTKTAFSEILAALKNTDKNFPPRYLVNFSDITTEDLADFKFAWPQVPPQRKTSFLLDLEELAEADTITNFDEIARVGLNDPEPEVRVLSIRLLWECDDRKLIDVFLKMLRDDPETQVKAAAASALGSYIYEGELDELSVTELDKIVDTLIQTYKTTPLLEVKRRALESLGFSSRDEVTAFILESYKSDQADLRASALFAMGRSADNQFDPFVKKHLRDNNPTIQLEAMRAAGELTIKDSREELLEMVDSGDLDEEVFYAGVWSLSQIGGAGVKAKFEEIMDSEIDDDLADFMETAMDNLAVTDGLADFDLFDLDEEEAE